MTLFFQQDVNPLLDHKKLALLTLKSNHFLARYLTNNRRRFYRQRVETTHGTALLFRVQFGLPTNEASVCYSSDLELKQSSVSKSKSHIFVCDKLMNLRPYGKIGTIASLSQLIYLSCLSSFKQRCFNAVSTNCGS